MEALLEVLRHLVMYGPARHPAELEHLLGLLGQAEASAAAPRRPSIPFAPSPAVKED